MNKIAQENPLRPEAVFHQSFSSEPKGKVKAQGNHNILKKDQGPKKTQSSKKESR